MATRDRLARLHKLLGEVLGGLDGQPFERFHGCCSDVEYLIADFIPD